MYEEKPRRYKTSLRQGCRFPLLDNNNYTTKIYHYYINRRCIAAEYMSLYMRIIYVHLYHII